MRTVATRVAAVLGVALVALTSRATSAAVTQVIIEKVAFAPAEISVRAGDTVEWVNRDPFVHTATGTHKEFRAVIQPGKSEKVVMKKAGTVQYFCEYHPNMTGKVTIAPGRRPAAIVAHYADAGSIRACGGLSGGCLGR